MPYNQFDDAVIEMHRLMRALDTSAHVRARTGQTALVPCPRPVRPLLTALVPHGMATIRRAGT